MSAVVVGFAGMTHLGIVAAVAAAERGFVVRGYDADERMAERLNRHDLPILDPDLGQLLAKKRDRICFTATARDLASCDVVYIAADAPIDDEGKTDLAPIRRLIGDAANNHADLLGTVARLLAPPCRLLWNVQCAESIDADIVRRFLVWFSAWPDAVVVNSLAGKQFHEQLGYRPRRWEHIPNGCDTNVFRFDAEARFALRAELGISDDTVAIGLPARFHPMKDHENFLAAAARLATIRPDTVFVLVGPGVDPSNRALGETIAAHGMTEQVRLLGARDDMTGFYSAIDVASLSSAFGEGARMCWSRRCRAVCRASQPSVAMPTTSSGRPALSCRRAIQERWPQPGRG
jgi:glycosyltransferase involved in cell wall biosynthesis